MPPRDEGDGLPWRVLKSQLQDSPLMPLPQLYETPGAVLFDFKIVAKYTGITQNKDVPAQVSSTKNGWRGQAIFTEGSSMHYSLGS